MPACNIPHGQRGYFPAILCRRCNPVDPDAAFLVVPAGAPEIKSGLSDEQAKLYRRKHRRRLRVEVRERSEFLDKLRAARAPQTDIVKAERAWKSAYADLVKMED